MTTTPAEAANERSTFINAAVDAAIDAHHASESKEKAVKKVAEAHNIQSTADLVGFVLSQAEEEVRYASRGKQQA